MSEREIELMIRVREGDSRAFEDLYHLYKKPIATFFHRLCGNPTKVDDLLQEVFFRVWKAAPGYEPKAKLSTYLFRIAHNLWINDSKKRKETTLERIEQEIETPPDLSMQETESKRKIERALQELPEGERECLILSHYSGLKYREISEVMGIPVGTVKSRIFSALGKLRQKLGPQ